MALTALLVNLLKKTAAKGFVKPDQSSQGLAGQRLTDISFTKDQMALVLDAMISESPSYKAEPTVSTVEDGSNISDHVTLKPITLKVEGIVSDSPVAAITGLNLDYLKSYGKGLAAGLGFGTVPSKDAHKLLYYLYLNRIPFDFVGGLQVYTNMVITDYSPVRTSKTGGVLQFGATMQQVRIVSSQTLQNLSASSLSRGLKKASLGTQSLSSVPRVDATGDTRTARAAGTAPWEGVDAAPGSILH